MDDDREDDVDLEEEEEDDETGQHGETEEQSNATGGPVIGGRPHGKPEDYEGTPGGADEGEGVDPPESQAANNPKNPS